MQAVSDAVIISDRTGEVKITTPQGQEWVLGPNDPLPDSIPDGSRIEILSGTALVAPESGICTVIIGDTICAIAPGEQAMFGYDANTGTALINNIQGAISAETLDVHITVSPGATVNISIDPVTRAVNVNALTGTAEVTDANGNTVTVNAGQSIAANSSITDLTMDADNYVDGEIQPEPERDETRPVASPTNP